MSGKILRTTRTAIKERCEWKGEFSPSWAASW